MKSVCTWDCTTSRFYYITYCLIWFMFAQKCWGVIPKAHVFVCSGPTTSKNTHVYIHCKWIETSPCHITLHAFCGAVAWPMAPLHRLPSGPKGSQRRPEVSNTLKKHIAYVYGDQSSNCILPCVLPANHSSNTTQMLPKGCPKVAQKLPKTCSKAAQKLSKGCPKAAQKLPKSIMGLPKQQNSTLPKSSF